MIKLKRDSGWADRARAYKVILDGNDIGAIKNGEEISFEVSDGNHELSLKIDWCRSNSIIFDVSGNTATFKCGNSLRGWKMFMSLIYVLFLPNQYLGLKKGSSPK